jgi:hypothetical protein
MDKKREKATEESAGISERPGKGSGESKSLVIAQAGVTTSKEFATLMSNLMSDLIEGTITPGVGNAVCNAGGKLLKIVELQQKYGRSNDASTDKTLRLTD